MSLFSRVRLIASRVDEDLAAAQREDPAARSNRVAIISGLHAIWMYRVAHWMWGKPGLRSSRLLSQIARSSAGIEIHPGATIGRRFFIDHGMGVVIGRPDHRGRRPHLPPGHPRRPRPRRFKRHPTIGNRVLIGAGAKVIGDSTVGDDAKIGANALSSGRRARRRGRQHPQQRPLGRRDRLRAVILGPGRPRARRRSSCGGAPPRGR